MKDVEKFQIRCHHLYAYEYHAYKFGDSSINRVGGDAGKLLADGRTDRRTARRTDGRTDNER